MKTSEITMTSSRCSTMVTPLHSVLMALLTTLISADVSVDSQSVGLRNPSLDGKVSNEHLLFQADVSTKLACASTCLKYDCCAAFSTSPKDSLSKTMSCRGHNSRSVTQTSAAAAAGSKTYFMKSRQSESSWLERPCQSNSDCPTNIANVVCDTGQCLCQTGYFYSRCCDACVSECPSEDLQSTFVKYPNRYIEVNNIEVITSSNAAQTCGRFCVANSHCVTFDTWVSKDTCYLQNVTGLSPGVKFVQSNEDDHYQRTCL